MTSDDREDIKRHFDVVAENLRSEIRLVAEGNAMTAESLERLRGDVEAFRAETARELAAVRSETRQVAEGVVMNTESLERFRGETARNFADVRSEIRLSYSDIDNRLKAVERQ
jgi:hypothetical protein